MGTMSEVETPTAIKSHVCSWCGQRIDAGERYRRYRYWAEGEAGTVKTHAECFDAMQEAAADEGGWIEWAPGDRERPSVPTV